jgi:dephospho-CoA kinase
MIVLGLTGSIGMGKSTVAAMFAEAGAPTFSSDETVHALYASGGAAVAPVEAAFPGVANKGAVDRTRLAARVLNDPQARQRLESIVHPFVAQAQADFLAAQHAAGAAVVVLDIPLLFETGGDKRVDRTVVVSAPYDIQRARVLARRNMTEDKFAAILRAQVPDAEKRARADFVIDTSRSLEATRTQVRAVLDALREQR